MLWTVVIIDCPNILESGHRVYPSFSISAYILENGGIEEVLTITEAEAQHSSPCKVSSSKSGAFSFSGKSSFSHGTLIGLLSVAIATVRRLMLLTKVLS